MVQLPRRRCSPRVQEWQAECPFHPSAKSLTVPVAASSPLTQPTPSKYAFFTAQIAPIMAFWSPVPSATKSGYLSLSHHLSREEPTCRTGFQGESNRKSARCFRLLLGERHAGQCFLQRDQLFNWLSVTKAGKRKTYFPPPFLYAHINWARPNGPHSCFREVIRKKAGDYFGALVKGLNQAYRYGLHKEPPQNVSPLPTPFLVLT